MLAITTTSGRVGRWIKMRLCLARFRARNHQFTRNPWRTSSPRCPGLGFWYTHPTNQPSKSFGCNRTGIRVLTEFPYLDKPPTKEFMQWQPEEIQNTVRPSGQTVRPSGQMHERAGRNPPICPSQRTHSAILARHLSAPTDTDKLPVGREGDRGPAELPGAQRETNEAGSHVPVALYKV
jgi:hypothetical protein